MDTPITQRAVEFYERIPMNVGPGERWASVAGGAILLLSGLRRGSLVGLVGAVAGGALLFRGLSSRCGVYSALGISTHPESGRHAGAQCGWRGEGSLPLAAKPVFSAAPVDTVDEASMDSFPASDPPSYMPRRSK